MKLHISVQSVWAHSPYDVYAAFKLIFFCKYRVQGTVYKRSPIFFYF